MKQIGWTVYNSVDHDAKVAKRLHSLLLKVYKYATKHGLWDVRMIITNDAGIPENCLGEDVECYAEVSAWYYDANVVCDATSLPIIEENI